MINPGFDILDAKWHQITKAFYFQVKYTYLFIYLEV